MATKAQAIKAVQAFGGSIDWENSTITSSDKYIIIDAPEGYVWDASESSVLCLNFYCGSASDFWDEVIDLVLSGTTFNHNAA